MKRLLLPAGIALLLHILFLSADMGWMKKKPAQPILPQPMALALTYRQPQVASPRPNKKIEKIQRTSIPSPKKDQPKPKPTKKKKKVVQTKIKTRPKKINPSAKTAKPQQAEPEKKIQAKAKPETVSPPESEVSYEQDPVIFQALPPFPDLYVARDEQDERVAALPDKKGAVSSSPIPTIQEAIPIYRKCPPPTYPRIARRRGYEGTVFLEVLVNEEGKVSDLRLFQSCGHRVLDKAALASVKYWLFEPGKKGDEKVEMWVKVPIRFQLR